MTTPVSRLARRSARARGKGTAGEPDGSARGNRNPKLDTTPFSRPYLPCEPQLIGVWHVNVGDWPVAWRGPAPELR